MLERSVELQQQSRLHTSFLQLHMESHDYKRTARQP